MESESGENSIQSGIIQFASSVVESLNPSSLRSQLGENVPHEDEDDVEFEKTDDVLVAALTPDESIADLQMSHANSITERIRKNKIREFTNDIIALEKHFPRHKAPKDTGNLLVDKIKLDHIRQLKKAFESAPPIQDGTVLGALTKSNLRNQIEKACKMVFSDEEWEQYFIKMDVRGHGYVLYDEFMNFLLLEFTLKENLKGEIALWMLETPIQDQPTFIRSHHRHGVVDIAFSPKVQVSRDTGLKNFSFANGSYLTVSEQGTVNTWSLNMELRNSVECPSPVLRMAKTCVLKIVALADINLIAISSTERDLRFYDTTGRHYQLKTRIIQLPFPATALCYHFYENVERQSIFAFGDFEGSVSLMKFSCKEGGPLKKFERSTNLDHQCITYDSLLRDAYANRNLTMSCFKNAHPGTWVMKIVFCDKIWRGKDLIVSCSNNNACSVVIFDIREMKIVKKFQVVLGVNTFCLVRDAELLITGGFDMVIRFWHIKSSKKYITSMSGHFAPIDALYEQHDGAWLFSISKDKVIKVWDTKDMVCIQTCSAKFDDLGDSPVVYHYNPYYKKCILAANNIAFLKFGPVVSDFFSEGHTHVGPVTKALYNPLFKVVVTLGMDSNIMTWDLWKGKLLFVVRKAHVQHILGEDRPMSISSAIFSPSKVYLLTGAVDGSVKIWNFTIGTCLRTMHIESDCVVTGLVWVPGRILACGWNLHVCEWEDEIEEMIGHSKDWTTVHTKHILAMVQCGPKAIVTAAYNGELVFYNLQNGHYYNRVFVGKPKLPITMGFAAAFRTEENSLKQKSKEFRDSVSLYTVSSSSSEDYSRPIGIRKQTDLQKYLLEQSTGGKSTKYITAPSKISVLSSDRNCTCETPCSCKASEFEGFAGPDKMEVHCLLFLETRPENPEVGSLFVSLQTGSIQFWSHHPKGGLIDTFFAVHTLHDYVTTMTTDEKNEFLFTGTRFGYVKIWHIANYHVLPEMVVHRNLPSLRLQFPFLWDDRILGRAKRAARGQKEPFLCSSCRNHQDRVMHVELLEQKRIYLSAGLDWSVRLWTYSGTFIGVLGGLNPWTPTQDNATYAGRRKIPADLSRVVSSTSFKVLTGRAHVSNPQPVEQTEKDDEFHLCDYTYSPLSEQLLGVYDFEEDGKRQVIQNETCNVDDMRKKIREPALRALNILRTVGQYDMSPPDEDKLAHSLRMLLEDQDRKPIKGRTTLQGQLPPTRKRPKERWADLTEGHLSGRDWAKDTRLAPGAATPMAPSRSDSQQSTNSSRSGKRVGLSPEAKKLETLLAEYEESAKGWYRQQT